MKAEEQKAWEELVAWAKAPGRKGYPMPMSNAILAADAELKRLRNETSIKNYFGTELADSANECMKLREENRRLREGVAEIKRKLFDLKINRAR
jgi:hypothetical protein